MIAKGFKPVGWVAGVATAALGCYMLSLQVAAERAELASIEQRIIAARQDIRALQTELGTRGRMTQLEKWNAEVLALSAPTAGQYLDSELRLARFDMRERTLEETAAEVRMAAAPAPATRATAAPAAPVRMASAPLKQDRGEPMPVVRQASLASIPPERADQAAATTQPRVRKAAASIRPSALIDDEALEAISATARTERRESGAR